jgi:hypothetical protein
LIFLTIPRRLSVDTVHMFPVGIELHVAIDAGMEALVYDATRSLQCGAISGNFDGHYSFRQQACYPGNDFAAGGDHCHRADLETGKAG